MPENAGRRGRKGTGGTPGAEEAETLALAALTFLAADPARLDRFLSLTGLTSEGLVESAHSRPVLAAVLGHLLDDESLLLTFAANAGCDPASLLPAYVRLGGEPPDA